MKLTISQVRYILKYIFRLPREISILLGDVNQMGTLMIALHLDEMWQKLPIGQKLVSLIRFNWFPSDKIIEDKTKELLINNFFGTDKDFANELYTLTAWLHSQTWSYDQLTESDKEKISAIMNVSIASNLRHNRVTSDYLHLKLFEKVPEICHLAHPMVAKIPILSIQFGLELHLYYTFQSIRASKHQDADKLINYLYEILNIQQKIIGSFHELIQHIDNSRQKNQDTSLMISELDALKEISIIIVELKATIEKSVVLLGLIFGIQDLDSKKHHQQKLSALDKQVPEKSQKQYYYEFIRQTISSDNLEELNRYRSGLFHKSGVADLQPHSFINRKPEDTSLTNKFAFLNDQHARNTATLICILALLTDNLIERMPPVISFYEYVSILSDKHTLKLKKSNEPMNPNERRSHFGCIPYEKVL